MHKVEFEGFADRVLRHEADRLQGVLFTDRVSELSTLVEMEMFDGCEG